MNGPRAHIGLIGGIGPAATIVYYRALVDAHAAAGRRLPLTIVNADSREMVANLEAGRAAEQAAIFARHIDALRAGGCTVAALTSMGGHFCFAELERIATLPLLGAVPALNRYFADRGLARVGVLGTLPVMASGLYGLTSVEVVAPPPEERAGVHAAYVTLATAGVATTEQRAFFQAAARRLHREEGVDAVVLGGTDLSIAFDGADLDIPIIDSALVHADAIARAAMTA